MNTQAMLDALSELGYTLRDVAEEKVSAEDGSRVAGVLARHVTWLACQHGKLVVPLSTAQRAVDHLSLANYDSRQQEVSQWLDGSTFISNTKV